MLKNAILAVGCAVLLTGASQASITVSGTGKIKYTPDIAYVNLGVSHEEKNAADAWKKNAEVVRKIFEALKAVGIAEKDMKTTGVNVSPKYFHPKDQEPRLIGYVATYDLTVTVRKLNEVGKVLDLAVEAGANRSAAVSFACSDPEKLLDQARTAAVAEARRKARLYVEGAGAALGLVRNISEGAQVPYRTYHLELAKAMKGDQALPIAAGEQELSVTVTLTYDIVHATKG